MRYRRPLIAFFVISALLSLQWLWLRFDRAVPTAPPSVTSTYSAGNASAGAIGAATAGGDFSLIDHDGRRVTAASFGDRFLLLSFGYTNCPDICPMTLDTLAQVLEQLGPLSDRLQPLFVTLDPERDSPTVLADYVPHFDPRIVGLGGSVAEVRATARGFGVRYAKAGTGPDYGIDHSAAFYLAAPDGRVLHYFRHDIDPAALTRKVATVLRTAPLGLTSIKDEKEAPAL